MFHNVPKPLPPAGELERLREQVLDLGQAVVTLTTRVSVLDHVEEQLDAVLITLRRVYTAEGLPMPHALAVAPGAGLPPAWCRHLDAEWSAGIRAGHAAVYPDGRGRPGGVSLRLLRPAAGDGSSDVRDSARAELTMLAGGAS